MSTIAKFGMANLLSHETALTAAPPRPRSKTFVLIEQRIAAGDEVSIAGLRQVLDL